MMWFQIFLAIALLLATVGLIIHICEDEPKWPDEIGFEKRRDPRDWISRFLDNERR